MYGPVCGAQRQPERGGILRKDLSSASDVIYNIQSASGYVSTMSIRAGKHLLVYFCSHIFIAPLFYVYIHKSAQDAEHACVCE